MPYYAWKGVTLTGDLRKGSLCARSQEDLEHQLLARDIAVMYSRQKSIPWWHRLQADNQFKIAFFRQLTSLLSSGIFLSEALTLMSQQLQGKPRVQEMIIAIVEHVQQGTPLSIALAAYPQIFDPLTIQMAAVGGDTGSLAQALGALCDDLEMKQDIRSRMRSAALLPGITFLFFITIAAALVLLILPRFTAIFSMHGAEVPWATKQLLLLSDVLRSWVSVAVVATTIVCGVLVRWYSKSVQGKPIIDRLVMRLPFIGAIMRRYVMGNALRSVSMLVGSGMPLVKALHVVARNSSNSQVRQQFLYVEQQVVAGASMSQAMQQIHESMFDPALIAAIRLAESSADLAPVLARIADIYYAQVKKDLLLVTTLLNPCLTIILGLMITALIMAVYVPIFSMSTIIGQQ